MDFGRLNLELSPSVLKGVRDHVIWQRQLDALREAARAWLESNRAASIIYPPATQVWHRWLTDDGPLGRALVAILAGDRGRVQEVRRTAQEWSQQRVVERHLDRTDEEIRQNSTHRRPIEARARRTICARTQEFSDLVLDWALLIESEPNALGDHRQQRADQCRLIVKRALVEARAEINRRLVDCGASPTCQSAARFVRSALDDLDRLFDASREESTEPVPARVVLCEELLGVPELELNEQWQPRSGDPGERLDYLRRAAAGAYDPERAFSLHSEVRDHTATKWILDALAFRAEARDLARRLAERRDEAVAQCQVDLRRKIEHSRNLVEQAVCYDLVAEDERARFLGVIEEGRLLLDEVHDFRGQMRELDQVEAEIGRKREQRLREARQRLAETEVPADRRGDIEVVNSVLDRGDFLTADEYVELIRKGQPLVHEAEPQRRAFKEFFPDFVNQFNGFMEGEAKSSRREPRELIEKVRNRQSFGPLDLRPVPGPQAGEAAEMLSAWSRLKNRPAEFESSLARLLMGLGFRSVQVTLCGSPEPPHWLASVGVAPLVDPNACVVPQFGSQAEGRYKVLGLYDRPDEETIVNLAKVSGREPLIALYFGRMTEQRRRDLAELCWQRGRSFLTVDESLLYFLCGERFNRLPVLFQCALPFTVAEPYTITATLVPIEMFFGRDQERRAVLDPYGTNLVYGGRQLGKSALLRDVQRREHCPAEGRIVRWIDLKNRGIGIDRPIPDLWAVVGQVLHEERVLSKLATTHQTVGDRIKDWLCAVPDRRILLLLDEADAFLESDSRSRNDQTGHSFPNVSKLKGLMDDTNRRFKVVFAGLHNVQRAARDPNTPVAHLGTPVCVGPLLERGGWRQARDLIEVPLRHMGFELDPPDLSMRILSYTNYYPSLIQLFCKHLLEYLHNPDLSTFDFRITPPYRVTARQVEDVYQSEDLQAAIRDRFELTLNLDTRYRLLALCIALASIERRADRALIDGFDVPWVRDQALSWWPDGFSDDPSYELFRTILDEMIGLGVLRRAGPDRYALRSPNVLNLLGSRAQIEQKLFDVVIIPKSPRYEASSFRRSLGSDAWTRSPLTAEQEGTLIESANSAVVVIGSRLSGLDDLRAALTAIPTQVDVRFARPLQQLNQFMSWLDQVDSDRQDGLTLAVVCEDSLWEPGWVLEAQAALRRKGAARKRFFRTVFVANPLVAWEWAREGEHLHQGIVEVALKPWRENALRRWLEDTEFGLDALRGCGEVLARIGGWALIIHRLGQCCREGRHNWREHLDRLMQSWPETSGWGDCCEIPPPARPVLREMAELNGPVTVDDLAELTIGQDVSRVLRWADRLGYARPTQPGAWELDPLVRKMVLRGE